MSDPKSPRRWIRFVLVASLGLNLLFVGMLVGGSLKHGKPDGPGGVMRGFIHALDKEDRRALRSMMRDQQDLRRISKANRAAILEALKAEPFDAAALRNALAAQRGFAEQFGRTSHEGLVEVIVNMTDAERAAFVARIESLQKKRRHTR